MVVVITGGTSGIGLETAIFLKDKGYTVYSLARSVKEIENINFLKCDVTKFEQIENAISSIIEKEKRIDYLINNAGFGISGALEFHSQEAINKIIDINLIGLINTTNVCLKYLRESCGMIINIGSVAGVLPIPFQTMYSLTKSAVNAYSLALRNEIMPFKIRVVCINPGDTKTGFTQNREKSVDDDIYDKRVKRSVGRMEKDEQNGVSPLKVSKTIYKCMKKKSPKIIVTVGFKYKFLVTLCKVLPIRIVNRILYSMYGK